jgi:ribosomal-protein-alanine N-acetyltransferase
VTRVEGIRLERPAARHAARFLHAVRASRALHRGLASPPKDGDEFAAYVAGTRRENREGFFVMTSSGDLAGVINVSEIVRGNFQSAYLGYYAFTPHAGRGYMRQGLALVVSHCFRRLGLHRLEANIQPGNVRSIALVRGLGFRLEGLSPRYLKICGRWRDHERWALRAEDWRSVERGSDRR